MVFFQCTTKPSQKKLGNVIAYYSGHYKLYGLNCHACVKLIYNSYILDLCCLGLQTTSLTHWYSLKETIDSLPLGLDGLTDAAYSLSKKLLISFMGAHRLDSVHDVFNYYLSQLQIHVDMDFGRLVNKFRILSGKIVGTMDHASAILAACAQLANFIIQEDGPFEHFQSVEEEIEKYDFAPNPNALLGMSYLPVVPNEQFQVYPQISHIRDAIVEHLWE
jgi:hypothetical protein